jgi:diguanylate cyclase (GGDEF)-like protein
MAASDQTQQPGIDNGRITNDDPVVIFDDGSRSSGFGGEIGDEEMQALIEETLTGDPVRAVTFAVEMSAGNRLLARMRNSATKEAGRLTKQVARLTHEVTERDARIVELETRIAELEALSTTDALTGLPNRRGFDQQLDRYLKRRDNEHFGLVILDLNDFKAINDKYGHNSGDVALQLAATALAETVRPGDFVARTGGDEFAILIDFDGNDDSEMKQNAMHNLCVRVASAIQTSFSSVVDASSDPKQSFDPESDLYRRVSASLGYTLGQGNRDGEHETAEQVKARADSAMYEAKSGGGSLRIASVIISADND